MKQVLVTGSEGFLGRPICEALETAGYTVIRFDKRLGHDVCREEDLKSAALHTEATIHLGAPCSARMFTEQPEESWFATVKGMKNVLSCCSGRIVFASTCTLYGESNLPVTEDAVLPPPPNLYAAGKIECERLCFQAVSTGVDVRILRIFAGYGPGEFAKGEYASPLMQFIRKILVGQQPIIFGDGGQIRDFVYIDDIVEYAVRAMTTGSRDRLFNVGTGFGISFRDLAGRIGACIGQRPEPEFTTPPKGYVGSIVADTQKARRELGYTAKVRIDEGIKRTIAALRSIV